MVYKKEVMEKESMEKDLVKRETGTGNKMETKSIFALVWTMALPPMISMLIQSLYNIIDSIFVARLSESALAAVSIVFPIQNLILSIAVGTGVGLSSFIAIHLGAKDKDRAEQACMAGMILSFIHYALILVIGLSVLKTFVGSFTNVPEVQKYGVQYGSIILIFCFGQIFHIAIEKIFQATGKMVIPMILQALGCVINIILDPILIFGLFGFPALGVQGAAIATVIGQIVSFLLGLFWLCKGKSGLYIKRIQQKKDFFSMIKQIYIVAVPSSLVMALPSLLVSGLNAILMRLSPIAVSVFGIYYKLQTFVYMPTNGLVQGIRPIIGYSYGAKNTKRERDTIWISLGIVSSIMLVGTVLFWIMPNSILNIFDATSEMKQIGVPLLQIISISFLPSTIGVIASATFESIGKGVKSLIITLLRQLIITLPCAIIFANIIGLYGVWIAFPIAEIIAAVVSIIFLLFEYKKRKNN